ncbi:class F sortase [Isoptericola sp. b490]|uniref:class F sortase n=1 Tax=Actinotalea lenta TaxID=3064654 RepID=UPI0027140183|nr:class F sortase [Isoptericola sp. b490]MDO8122025.1 class F sortase [Isoptericola sp. b490]
MNPARRTVPPIVAAALAVPVVVAVALGPAGRDRSAAEASAGSVPSTALPPSPTAVVTPTAPTPDIPVRDATAPAAALAPAPVHLSLPTIGADLPVDPVGVAQDGQMEIPPLAERAGWYRFGPAPGSDRGSAVIAAHVDSDASGGTGPFVRLHELAQGDVAQVDLADGSTLSYRVDQVVSVPKADVAWPDVFTRQGAPRLVLVTCGGTWQPAVRHYSNNVIAYLSPVGP